MKIMAYVHLNRLVTPIGVGHHTIEMVNGLSAAGADVRLLTAKLEPKAHANPLPQSSLGSLPLTTLPFTRRTMEAAWLTLDWPKVDRWCGDADWLYLPMEAYVPSSRIPVAVTLHDVVQFETDLPWSLAPEAMRARRRWHWKYRKMLPRAGLLLTVSEFSKRRLVELFDVDPDRIAVVGNGIAEEYFYPADAAADTADAPRHPYLFASNGLQIRKGGKYLVEVAKALLDAKPEMRIIVTGNWPGLEHLNCQESCPNIERLGYISTSQQATLIRGARALLMLSIYEGFGMPALEAMAAGTPAIVSNCTALPETVGNAGILVDASNTAEVISAIHKIEQPDYRRDIIARGLARASQFHWHHAVQKLLLALQSRS